MGGGIWGEAGLSRGGGGGARWGGGRGGGSKTASRF